MLGVIYQEKREPCRIINNTNCIYVFLKSYFLCAKCSAPSLGGRSYCSPCIAAHNLRCKGRLTAEGYPLISVLSEPHLCSSPRSSFPDLSVFFILASVSFRYLQRSLMKSLPSYDLCNQNVTLTPSNVFRNHDSKAPQEVINPIIVAVIILAFTEGLV